jgi:hypothetical protein
LIRLPGGQGTRLAALHERSSSMSQHRDTTTGRRQSGPGPLGGPAPPPSSDKADGRDKAASQEAHRASAALDNQREGYGGPTGGRSMKHSEAGDSAREVARRQGEHDE